MQKSKPYTLRAFIWAAVKPYKAYLLLFSLVAFLWALTNTFLPYVIKLIIDKAMDFSANKSLAFAAIKPYIFLYLGLWICLALDGRLLDWVKLKFFPSLRRDVMTSMYAYLNQHSHVYFQNNFAGSLVNKINDMHGGIIQILTVLDDIYAQFLGLSIACLTLLYLHPIFALILVAWVLTFFLITLVFLRPITKLSHVFSAGITSLVGKMVDSIGNIATIRLFARHADENRYIGESINDTIEKDRSMLKKILQMRLAWDLSIIVLIGINLFTLASMYAKNLVTLGDFSFIMYLSISILWNLWFIAEQFVSFSEQTGKCKQALSLINAPWDIVDVKDAKALQVTQGCIEFKQVSFHYGSGSRLFQNKNVKIEPGQRVGLVGFSGSGKSSFANLILRLFELEAGHIYIDHQDISQVTQASLRENIALISQDVSLFHRSLRENISYGRPEASDKDIIAASKAAHCHEFIDQLQEGYATLVGERGIKLSGGQRQRIAIARAILKNAPILILDEATSALDSVTEQYIQEALEVLMQGKTTLVIAHRLSTLAAMHRILVFDEGKIIEDGSHEELLAQKGHYAKLWQMQAGGFLPETDELLNE